MVNFGGWDMPIHYGSKIEENHSVRQTAGAFDVSHMTVLELRGGDIEAYLDKLLTNDIRKLSKSGQAMYYAILNEDGGVLDDLIVYSTGNPTLVVVNGATCSRDIAWMRGVAKSVEVDIQERVDLAVVAVQGPDALTRLDAVLDEKRPLAAARLLV